MVVAGRALARNSVSVRSSAVRFVILFLFFATISKTRTCTAFAAKATTTAADTTADTSAADTSSSGVQIWPNAFTPTECDAIIALMKTLPVQVDDRNDQSVKRTNYFDQGGTTLKDAKYQWILERIRGWYARLVTTSNTSNHYYDSLDAFVEDIDFLLMHEFEATGFFDWHVDTKPHDGTGRTDNINLMLSDRHAYQGGELTVGSTVVPAQQGNLYTYPASFPHRVADITGGRRHTLILAMKSSSLLLDKNHAIAIANQMWDRAEANHQHLCASHPTISKFHLLYAQFLEALQRPTTDVDAKYADMYASTDQAQDYVTHFRDQGHQLTQAGSTDDAKGYLRMATMIQERLNAPRPLDDREDGTREL